MTIEQLEEIRDDFIKTEIGHTEEDMLDIALFMQYSIDILNNIIDRQEQLFGKVKKLEQAQTYYPFSEEELTREPVGGTD